MTSWLWWVTGGILLALPFMFDAMVWTVIPGLMAWLHGIETSRVGMFCKGYLSGFIFVYLSLWWLFQLSIVIHLITAAFFALYVGILASVTGRIHHQLNVPGWLIAPAGIYLMEFLPEYVTLFPVTWLHFGHLLWQWPQAMQIAELGGVSLLTAVLMVVASGFYYGGRALVQNRIAAFRYRATWIPVLAALSAVLLTLGYGHGRLIRLDLQPLLRVAVVQANIPQALRTHDENATAVITEHAEMTLALRDQPVDLALWPESSVRYFLERSENIPLYLGHLTREIRSPLLLGAIGFNGNQTPPSNSAFLIDASGQLVGRADKMVLVPFAERLPLIEHFPLLRDKVSGLLSQTMRFRPHLTAGSESGVLVFGEHRIGVMICYDDAVPGPSAALLKQGAQALATLSNEAWFADRELTQHVAMATLRCIETRLPMVRATHTGETCIIDPAGRITKRLEHNQRDILIGTLHKTDTYRVPAWIRLSMHCGVSLITLIAFIICYWPRAVTVISQSRLLRRDSSASAPWGEDSGRPGHSDSRSHKS